MTGRHVEDVGSYRAVIDRSSCRLSVSAFSDVIEPTQPDSESNVENCPRSRIEVRPRYCVTTRPYALDIDH